MIFSRTLPALALAVILTLLSFSHVNANNCNDIVVTNNTTCNVMLHITTDCDDFQFLIAPNTSAVIDLRGPCCLLGATVLGTDHDACLPLTLTLGTCSITID